MSFKHIIVFAWFVVTAVILFGCFLTDESPCESKHYWWYLAVIALIALTDFMYVVNGCVG